MVSDDPRQPRPTGNAGLQANRERRVRFVTIQSIRELPENNIGHADRRRQTILPGDDGSSRARRAAADKQLPSEPEGPIRSLDPVLAATRRARIRAEVSRMQLLEDTSLPNDLAAAEEDYDEPEELYNEDGIPIEPFHLRAEREAGYFDAEGNYLEYRLEAEDTDAWLESIMDEHHQVRADPELAARRRRAAATVGAGFGSGAVHGGPAAAAAAAALADGMNTSKGRRQRRNAILDELTADIVPVGDGPVDDDEEEEEEDGPYDMHMLDDTGAELEDDERAVYQKRVADLLQPLETPLDGLRRLGRVMHGGAAGPGVAAASATTAEAAGQPAVAPDATVATGNERGGTVGVGGDGGNAVLVGDVVPLLSAPAGAAPVGLGSLVPVGGGGGSGGGGGGGGDDADGGASGSMVHLSCGERQRLRKQRREHQGGTALADPPPPPPPSPSQHRQQPEVEAGEAGKEELVAAAAGLLEQSHVKNERRVGKEVSEEESIGGRAQSRGDVDMEDLDGSGAEASEPLRESRTAGLRPADAPPSPAARQSVAEATVAAAARRRAPAVQPSEAVREARRQFDSLTSYANLLLSAGMYDVYSSTREQLLRAAQRTLGVDVVRSLTVAGLRPIGQVAAPGRATTTTLKRPASSGSDAMAADAGGTDAGGGGGGGGGGGTTVKRKRLDMNFMEGMIGPHDVGKEDELVEEGDGAVTGFDAANMTTTTTTSGPGGSVRATRMTAVDMDVDMFGEDDDGDGDVGTGGGSAPQSAAGSGSGSAAGDETDRSLTVAAAEAAEAAAGASTGVNGDGAAGLTAMEVQGCLPPPAVMGGRQLEAASGVVDAAAGPSGTLPDRDGFELDPDSGYVYSSKMGYYYDTATGLYGDANTGLWYRYMAAEGPGASRGDDEGLGSSGGGGEGGAKPVGRFELATTVLAEQQQPTLEKQEQIGRADMQGQQPDS
ncbi:hypothetical protein VaNZ11_004725 [Volvox africanus]|uniref:OCRE domain-containing protein n=1 Tax=Volvox africanus TaxID=51714 RepID=A0ABQ5RY09_9CHLO|nr:hypothetical protein VaNZ11_004725 [Volvox africanus]